MSRWNSWLPGSPGKLDRAAPMGGFAELRAHMLGVLDDCTGPAGERLRAQLMRCRNPCELWLARMDIYQLLAREHCETRAAQRIDALVPLFEGHLPAGMLRIVGSSSVT